MKATGIVRRMDDLGRIVIPKEIRRNIGAKEGDPFEIYIGEDGVIAFKLYKPDYEGQVDILCTQLESQAPSFADVKAIKEHLHSIKQIIARW